jgi:hypothetical protein
MNLTKKIIHAINSMSKKEIKEYRKAYKKILSQTPELITNEEKETIETMKLFIKLTNK